MAAKYPKEVPVVEPGDVGRLQYTHDDGSPCCAFGWIDVYLNDSPGGVQLAVNAYMRCAREKKLKSCGVASINDSIRSPATRALLVNAAFAALGYVLGQQPEAVKLARKAGYDV